MPQYKPQSPRRLSPAEGHDLHFFPYYRVVVYPSAVFSLVMVKMRGVGSAVWRRPVWVYVRRTFSFP